jgi:hypothetical protein
MRVRLVVLRGIPPVAVIKPHKLIAVNAVERQDDHHDEVRNEQGDIERVPAIPPVKYATAGAGDL